MTDFSTLQQQFVRSLVKIVAPLSAAPPPAPPAPVSPPAAGTPGDVSTNFLEERSVTPAAAPSATPSLPPVPALINALPYYGDPSFQEAHRGAIVNLLETSLPNDPIAAAPSQSGLGNITLFSYSGPYSGYRDAFFPEIVPTPAALAVASATNAASSALNLAWWGQYSVAVLTDAIRLGVGASLNIGSLSSALSTFAAQLQPGLSASYLAVLKTGYSPTMAALAQIGSDGQAAALAELTAAISEGQFTANVAEAISMGGDQSSAATWFLYNLWMAVAALGGDVDKLMPQFQSSGLPIPPQVGVGTWWNGGYSAWFDALSGSDVQALALPTMSASFPESESTASGDGGASFGNTTVPNGYVSSFCNWGPLAQYNPPPVSCFGAGTLVLMADGTTRAIERVTMGDRVLTDKGPRSVALVERPERRARSLYSINGLALRVSAGHPLRASAGASGAFIALDPWLLLDTTPTAASLGVAPLRPGSLIAGSDGRRDIDVRVERIEQDAHPQAAELVYDLVLEGWGEERAAYYVGGPQHFVAAYPETADPKVDPPSALAVATALQRSIAACRANVRDLSALDTLLARISPESLCPGGATPRTAPAHTTLPRLPGPSFYLRDGSWCPHASQLEAAIIRQHGRRIRRCTSRCAPFFALEPGATLAALVHDVQWVSAAPETGTSVDIVLSLRRRRAADTVQRVAISQASHWHLIVDEMVDLGTIDGEADAFLTGSIEQGGAVIARFRSAIPADADRLPSAQHLLFDADRRALGWLSLTLRHTSPAALAALQEDARTWTKARATRVGAELGERLGEALCAIFTSR